MRKTLLMLCLLPLFATAAPSVTTVAPAVPAALASFAQPVTADALDAAVKQYLGADFNGVVLVRRASGQTALVRTFGLANIADKLPLKEATPFQIGSISKWMSSVVVLRLVDQGKLALDVPIKTYLKELPEHTGGITLRQLLSNSAGIPNGAIQEYKRDPSMADLPLSHLEASKRYATAPLLFQPGTAWEYAPTTWIVVAAIVEQVTGTPFSTAIDELVLRPANARDTAVPLTPFKNKTGAALGYKAGHPPAPGDFNMAPHMVFVAASGTIYSTAADLANLAHTVYETPLLSAGARAELVRVMVPSENYALGGRVLKLTMGGRERNVAWETGAVAGYKSVLAYVPGEGKTVVILNNTSMDQSTLATAAQAMLKALY
jgi:CubicO group peptidase (beta-lactamase class C family)